MEKSETVKQYNIDMQGRRAVEHENGQWCLASTALTLSAQVRELEDQLSTKERVNEILAKFVREATYRANAAEQSIATAREEALNRAAVKIYEHRLGTNNIGWVAFNNGLAIAANCIEAIKEEYRGAKP
jgi:hypothetical protein